MNSTISGNGQPPPHFVGMKVEVGIPLSDNTAFRDWAIINQVENDLISLQLSRDILPAGVSLRVGQILTIRSEYDFQVHICRAYIVSKGFEQELLLRLTGAIVANELREFYRIDAFLPIRFHSLPGQDPENVNKLWHEWQKQRMEEEKAREQRRLEARREKIRAEKRAREQRLQEGAPSVEGGDGSREEEELDNEYDESWGSVTSVAVNISGGGLRISTDQLFPVDEPLLLEIFVPSSRRIVDVAARVIFSRQNDAAGERQTCFNTGLQFMFIDEAARSAINQHTSGIQLKRIRQFKGFADVEPLSVDGNLAANRHYAYLDTVEAGESHRAIWWKRRRQLVLGMVFAGIIWLLYLYFSAYVSNHPKSVIHQMFETGIRKMKGEL
ncbi:PilZ-like domain-containing protein [Pelobacter propionicus]|nr:PilZ-like domain-containing protein [Pelobacter propionicus]